MFTTVHYIFITAIRDWLFVALSLGLLAVFGMSMFLGSTALVEQEQASLAYAAGIMRIVLSLGLVVFVAFHVQRMFDNKEIDVILTRPLSRTKFVFAYFLGFITIATLLTIVPVILVSFLSPNAEGLFVWSLSLLFESWIVVTFTMFAALILKSTVSSVLLAYAFYVMSRMMGFLLYYTDPGVYPASNMWEWAMKKLLLGFSLLLPRLDQFAQSEWLLYGMEESGLIIFQWQALLYIPFLLALAVADFRRKQF